MITRLSVMRVDRPTPYCQTLGDGLQHVARNSFHIYQMLALYKIVILH